VSARTALITGVTGQDGSYLAELLLDKGYAVHGMVRRSSTENYERIAHLAGRVTLHQGDLLDPSSLLAVLRASEPQEVYNLAAQSFVPTSWQQPTLTGEFTALGVTRLLEAVRVADPAIRFYQASSSEMFGKVQEMPQSETTPFYPRSPYAVAKMFGHWITVNYRESFGLFAVSGILFNHESPRRGREFVSRHVSEAVAKLKLGLADHMPIGNTTAHRDWGYAPEYVDAMWRMLQQPEAQDFVIGTGEQHSVQEFIDLAFAHVGLDPADFVRTDPTRLRPAEVDTLLADPGKAKRELDWTARTPFAELVRIMVEADVAAQERLSGRRVGGPGTR
jgi:GDPmannose 4,6-dehydratase